MPRKAKRTALITLAVLAGYSVLGFFLVPVIARHVINGQLETYATVPASLERVRFNPFSLEVTLFDLKIGEPGIEQIAFQRLYTNLEIDSIWKGAVHLSRLELEQPVLDVRFDKSGNLNLAQLFDVPPSEASEEPKNDSLFPLIVDELSIQRGDLKFADARPSDPVTLNYTPIDLELQNLNTSPEQSTDMRLTASEPGGGRLEWTGSFEPVPIRSSGQLSVSDFDLASIWPYIKDAVPLTLNQGQLSASTHYSLDLAETTQLILNRFALNTPIPLSVDRADGKPLIRIKQLEIGEGQLDLTQRSVALKRLHSEGLETWAAREEDGRLDWQTLFSGDSTPTETSTEPAGTDEPAQPWRAQAEQIQLRDYRIHLTDRVPQPEVALELGPLNVDVEGFDTAPDASFALKLDTAIGEQGSLSAAGNIQLEPMTAKLQVETKDIDLRVAQSYITPYARVELRAGRLSSATSVELSAIEPLALNVTGRATIDQLHTVDTDHERDLVKWQKLDLEDIAYEHGKRLSIERVGLEQPYTRFVINENLTTNFSDLLVPQAGNTDGEDGTETSDPLAIHIGKVDIADGSANFADFSLRPPFVTAMQSLNGSIGTLDNASKTPANVTIKGNVDRYAPVSITGELTPFDPMQKLDIRTSFNQVELTTLTPYSSKFAGYRIRKGRLDLDLHYRIDDSRLNADNHVTLDQLELGERVESPDAVDLPIRLAIALLKDSNGRIDIALPVQGDLDNPQFDVMPVVWQTLRNLVLRAAQAPFKFMAGLVSGAGDQDLSVVGFAAGSSELNDNARSALDLLARALAERPALRIEVEGTSSPAADGPLLAQERLEREYQEVYFRILQRRGDTVPAKAEALQVPEEDKPALLAGIYRQRLKQQPPEAWNELPDEERTRNMRSEVLASWQDSEPLRRLLAQQRAEQIKEYLVSQRLAADRIYLIDVSNDDAKNGQVNTRLQLGAM
ncbi:DUF748 domain-containing protein [Pseudomonas matsuisoli]|uniref:DUF748 domain-containing protein n=1 Tax=Pseudomonas matsuisoli TaxID=1515666 RepID=A0A917UZA8_9PSED|nr:DUF748 domain-containing protein [Pseudomonas matsuisoli]GGJ99859.1 hypothetical protein GCM10009304_27080 [Pseudomonas matsuisoli]